MDCGLALVRTSFKAAVQGLERALWLKFLSSICNNSLNTPAGVLRELLQIELKNLSHNARSCPCTAALNEVMTKANPQSTVLVISNQNHDAEDLAVNLQALAMKGNAVISV